jgi:L-fucono-1,5-lactonase
VIVDAHNHFWDPTRAAYPWMTDELAKIRRPFGPGDLEPELRRWNVDRSIVVQARADLDETRELLATAAATDFLAGVVGWVDLTDGRAAQIIASLKQLPGGSKLVGIRHQVHDEPDAAWLLRDDVRRGLAAVGDAGLAYDVLVRTRELPAALETARRFPDMRFVIDHIAKPSIRDGRGIDAWAEAMAPFSELSNVSCKLSGMVTEADWTHWQPRDLAPYVVRVLGWFGATRCLFGSDWPVCLLAADYGQVINALRATLDGLDRMATDQVLGGTAIRVYRLPPAGRA